MKPSHLVQVPFCFLIIAILSPLTTTTHTLARGEETTTPEESAWEQVDSLSKQSLEDFLKQFPSGTLAQQARIAIELQDQFAAIRDGKAKPGIIIPLDVLGDRWKNWQQRRPEKGATGYFVKEGKELTTLGWFSPDPLSGGKTGGGRTISFDSYGVQTSPTGDGSIIAFRTGGLKYEFLKGIIIETPGEEPMYFGVLADQGLAHVKGAGTVTLPDGKTTRLK